MKTLFNTAFFGLWATFVVCVCYTIPQVAWAQENRAFEQALAEITQGQPIAQERVKIAADDIVKEGEPLQVTVTLFPTKGEPHDEMVELYLLISKGPWPKAYSAKLQSRDGRASFSTRIRVLESCTLHAIALIEGKALFGATQDVKVSAGAYSR